MVGFDVIKDLADRLGNFGNHKLSRRGVLKAGFSALAAAIVSGCAPQNRWEQDSLEKVINRTGKAWANFFDIEFGSPADTNCVKQGYMDLTGNNDRGYWASVYYKGGVTYSINHYPSINKQYDMYQPEFMTLACIVRGNKTDDSYIEFHKDNVEITTITYGNKVSKLKYRLSGKNELSFISGNVANAFNQGGKETVRSYSPEADAGKKKVLFALAIKNDAKIEEGISYTVTKTDTQSGIPNWTGLMREKEGEVSGIYKNKREFKKTFFKDTRVDCKRDQLFVSTEFHDFISDEPVTISFSVDLRRENDANVMLAELAHNINQNPQMQKYNYPLAGFEGEASKYSFADAIFNEMMSRTFLISEKAGFPLDNSTVNNFVYNPYNAISSYLGSTENLQDAYDKAMFNKKPLSQKDDEQKPDPALDRRSFLASFNPFSTPKNG